MISVSYFGKDSAKTSPAAGQSKAPVWSNTWEKSPFNKGVVMDWKTGKLRTPLFEGDEEEEKKTTTTTVNSGLDSAVPCQITGGNSLEGYTVNVYARGKDEAVTDVGTLSLLEVSCTSSLPEGAWVMGHPATLALTGGTET